MAISQKGFSRQTINPPIGQTPEDACPQAPAKDSEAAAKPKESDKAGDRPAERRQDQKRLAEVDSQNSGDAPAASITMVVMGLASSPGQLRKPDVLSLAALFSVPENGPLSLPVIPFPKTGALESAAAEAAQKLAGVKGPWLEQLGVFPGQTESSPALTCAYLALTDQGASKFGSGARPGRWLSVKPDWEKGAILLEDGDCQKAVFLSPTAKTLGRVKVDGYEVASSPLAPGHAETLLKALERLRDTIDESDRIFNLMPEAFSLSQLQMIFESLSGARYPAPAFRRKIAPRVAPTAGFAATKQFRPARLFRYDPDWKSAGNPKPSAIES